MLVFSKEYPYRCVFLLLVLFLLGTFLLAGCSSSGGGGSDDVPLAAPSNMGLTAASGSLTVQFSRVAGIGAEGSENYPSYEISIGTNEDGSNKHVLGTIPSEDSQLVRFTVVRTATGEEAGQVFAYPQLLDGQKYWIFVRSYFEGYGYSDYTKLEAVAIPMPQPITGFRVVTGDKRVVVTWDAKEYEEYGVMIDDCPRPIHMMLTNFFGQYPNFWNVTTVPTTGNNYVFAVDNNTASHQICMVSMNVNGRGGWAVSGTLDFENKQILYDTTVIGQAATEAPAAPAVTIVKNANKRVDISFPADFEGSDSASDYQYAYTESGANTWSNWEPIVISSLTDGVAHTSLPHLENGKMYDIKVRAVNTVSGTEGASVQGMPVYTELNFNNPDEYLSRANAEYIYAENVPHSDFWRISTTFKRGGRSGTDRLVRGKETAVGNLYADAVQWGATEMGYATDFAWLIGDMINTGIQRNQTITPRFLQGITNQTFTDDTVVIVTLKGSDLISSLDYSLDLNNYPAVGTNNGYTSTLFGQAAAVYRNGHYGGSGGTTYNGVYWGLPSKEVRYTIQYKDYSLDAFNEHFNGIPGCVDAYTENDGAYDSAGDPLGCYLMTYAEAWPESGAPGENSIMGYKRGKIKEGSLTIKGVAIDPNATYRIATTKRIADSHYVAFLKGVVEDTGVNVVRAVAEYIYNNGSAGMDPYLDGRVKIEGGVPGDNRSDFK